MNSVNLVGRLARDPELRYTNNQTPVCQFTLAVDRRVKPGEERQADFIRITVFGKVAENAAKYLTKGKQAAVTGRLQTGSYQNKNGDTIYTTDVIAAEVQFLTPAGSGKPGTPVESFAVPDDFEAIDDDIPF